MHLFFCVCVGGEDNGTILCARRELLLSHLLLLNMLSVNRYILPTVLFCDSTQRSCVNILSFSNVFFSSFSPR